MPLPTFYATGTVSVDNGATTVTGSGTGWGDDAILAGDLFMDPAQPEIPPQRIASVTDATHLVLAAGWPGADMSADAYEIRFVGYPERSTAQTRRYLEMLGQLAALGIQPNAFGEYADRDAYDEEAKGFIFLSLNGNAGATTTAWTLFTKLSATDADWSAGQTMEGAPGPQGDNVVWLAAAGAPGGGTGADGDMYLNTTNGDVYGPKAAGAWGGSVGNIKGVQGNTGPANSLAIGTVTGGPSAEATIEGDAPEQILNLVLPKGDTGATGRPAGLFYQYDTATTGDPGTGHFGFNNATVASATNVRFSETDGDGVGIAALLASFDDSTSTTARGLLIFRKDGASGTFAAFQITSAITDSGAYDSFTVSHVASAGTFSDEDGFSVEFYRTGNIGTTGAAGANGGVTFTFSTTTTDADPGNGAFRFNVAIASLATVGKLYIDNQDTNAVSMTAWLDTFDDSTSSTKGYLVFKGVTQSSAIGIFKVTSSVVDGTGYRKVDLAYVAHGGTWTNGNTFSVLFMATGDKGTDGLGAGDVVGPSSAVDNHVAVFDSTTGKLIKDSGVVLGTAAAAATGTSAGNVPVLDAGGKLDTAVLPAIAITDTFAVASQSAMLALTAEKGDIAIRSDLNKTFVLSTNSPSTLADWKEMLTPTDLVLSVAGLTGAISSSALKTALAMTQSDVSGLGTGDNPQFAGINLGHASDTTLTRSAAGKVDIEGHTILTDDEEDQAITGGARVTVKDLGNLSGASITPDPGDRPIQKVTNNGAGSILPGSNEGQYTLEVLNTTGAGAITTTGWTLKGDGFDTTTTSKFLCSCLVTSDMKAMTVVKVV